MSESSLQIGDVIRFDEQSTRRRFLRTLGVAGLSVAGLRRAIEKAHGAEPEGVPVARTVHGPDVPASVELVHKEEYRAWENYAAIDKVEKFDESVHEVELERPSGDPGDLRIRAFTDRRISVARRANPRRIRGIPIEYERKTERISPGPASDDDSVTTASDSPELKSGVPVNGNFDETPGTLGLIAHEDNLRGNPLLITAKHVVAEDVYDQYSNISSQLDYPPSNTTIGNDKYDLPEHDVAAYKFNDNGTTYSQNVEDNYGPIRELWTYLGLHKAVYTHEDGGQEGQLPTDFYGRVSGHGSTQTVFIRETKSMNGGSFQYVAAMDSYVSQNGDSGCPFWSTNTDTDRLVGLLHGTDFGNRSWVMIPSAPNMSDDSWADVMNLYLW